MRERRICRHALQKHGQIENDALCFLRAESSLGIAKGYKNIVAIAIGTGIGGAIMVEGKLYRGSTGSAGEFGHTVLGIADRKLHVVPHTFEKLGAKVASEKYGDTSEIIAIGIANIINSFDPEIVVLGGGGIASGGISIEIVQEIAKNYIISPFAKNTPIVKGVLGEYAQAMGAALLA